MCGIAGILDPHGRLAGPPALLRTMGDAIAHRGPDDHGEWWEPGARVGLAHRRLAIIDLSAGGAQPMTSASGRYVIAFNGEIYDYEEIRAELCAAGAAPPWRGHSDTEVLLAAIEHWGVPRTLARANGMFAFALWDAQRRKLTLARDRFGEKPLYFGESGGVVSFGSELKSLTPVPGFDRTLDRRAVAALLRFGYVPSPLCIYSSMRKLPAGTYLELDAATPALDRMPVAYWSPIDAARDARRDPLDADEAGAIEALDVQLRRAVRLRMFADVPLGAFLSGGVDSSLVVALMQAQSDRPVRTFTIGFGDAAFDEAANARAVAQHLGTAHTEMIVSPDEAREVIPRLAEMYDEPFGDSSQIPTFLVSRMARRDVTVALSGDGGDELFGGYNRHVHAPRLWSRISGLPEIGRRAVRGMLLGTPAAVWDTLGRVASPVVPALRHRILALKARKLGRMLAAGSADQFYQLAASTWQEAPLPAGAAGSLMLNPAMWPAEFAFAERMMAVDTTTYLPDDILVKVDRASMAVSLEVRVPLLDPHLYRFAWQLPLDMRVRDDSGKWILRRVLDRYVPRALIDRPKMGFGIPLDDWLRGPLRPWVEELLSEHALGLAGAVDPAPVRALWAAQLNGSNEAGALWPVLMLHAWLGHGHG